MKDFLEDRFYDEPIVVNKHKEEIPTTETKLVLLFSRSNNKKNCCEK